MAGTFHISSNPIGGMVPELVRFWLNYFKNPCSFHSFSLPSSLCWLSPQSRGCNMAAVVPNITSISDESWDIKEMTSPYIYIYFFLRVTKAFSRSSLGDFPDDFLSRIEFRDQI